MKITLLGTGSPIPDARRAGPATLVEAGGQHVLVDCGRGVSMRLAAAGLPSPIFLHQVLLTHLHSDHVTDFNDLVTMRWAMSPVPSPLPVTGPPGTEAFAQRTLDMLRPDIGYRRAHHDDLGWDPACQVREVLDEVVQLGELTITVAPTDHRPVAPTVGYRIDHDGRSVVLAGDTVPCDSLDRLVAGADVYVQTVVRPDLITPIAIPRLTDICDYHSSVEQAAQTASRAGVRTLVLTHMVPAPAPGEEQPWIDLAREHFDGEVVVAEDLTVVEI
ncbi:MAG: MBL fold metallo-hydrolase [Microthrixaceae bacterium]